MYFLIMVICEVGLSCQTYGSSSPALSVLLTHAVLRYGFLNSQWFFGFRSLHDILGLSL